MEYFILGLILIIVLLIFRHIIRKKELIDNYYHLQNLLHITNANKGNLFLCHLSQNMSKSFIKDLKQRLSDIDYKYPGLRFEIKCNRHKSSKEISEKDYGMWFYDDFESRDEFINLILEELET